MRHSIHEVTEFIIIILQQMFSCRNIHIQKVHPILGQHHEKHLRGQESGRKTKMT